jgi:hypothetical protein
LDYFHGSFYGIQSIGEKEDGKDKMKEKKRKKKGANKNFFIFQKLYFF